MCLRYLKIEPLVLCWDFPLFFLYDFKKDNVILDIGNVTLIIHVCILLFM